MDKFIEVALKATKFSLNDIDFKINEEGVGKIWIKLNGSFFPLEIQKGQDTKDKTFLYFNQDQLIAYIETILKQKDLTYADFKKLKDIDTSHYISIGDEKHYFRVNLFFTKGRPGIIMRYIKTKIPTIEDINIPNEYITPFLNAVPGLRLVSGSTGSGKSTTIAAFIDYYNKNRHSHILTLEDPIEYRFPDINCGINQREIGTDSNEYINGLLSSLRQAPDIIFLGELREFNTIDLALKLSESGHIVISTIHTKDASSVISRILNTTPKERLDEVRTTLASAFRGVINQELIKTKDGKRVIAIETMYDDYTVSTVIQQNELGKLRSIIETNRNKGMITKRAYIEQYIIPKNIVSGEELKKVLNGK